MGGAQCCASKSNDMKTFDEMGDTLATSVFAEEPEPDAENPEDCSLTSADANVGDHVCPVVGAESAKAFLNGDRLNKLFDASQEDLGRSFSLTKDSIKGTAKGGPGAFACAIADPNVADCPLVFVSSGFEDLTGYTTAFTTGRSCRFLQPTSKILNDAVNLNDRKIMFDFCAKVKPVGSVIVNLLLNERYTGERFWNLLRMQHVAVDGVGYILGVQTTLDAYMPKVLERRAKSRKSNETIVNSLGDFLKALTGLREDLQRTCSQPMMELKGYFTCAMNYLQVLPILSKAAPQLLANPRNKGKKDKEEVDLGQFVVGATVTTKKKIHYPSSKIVIPKGTSGEIVSIDAFGNIVCKWKGASVSSGGVLKRDFDKVQITSTPKGKK